MCRSVFLSLILLILKYPIPLKSSAGWLRFCANGKTFHASPTECSGGYWLKKTTSPQCVCAHGVWVISKGYCDPHYAIIVGVDGSCFALSAEVRWIRMIGVANSPFAPFYFISNKCFDKIETIAGSSISNQLMGKSIYAGAISPSKSLQSMDGTICLKPKRVEISLKNISESMNELPEDAISEVYPDGFSFGPVEADEKPWAFEQLSVCDPSSNEFAFVYGVKPNHFYQNSELVNASSIPNTCNSTCTAAYESVPIEWDLLTPEERASGLFDYGGSSEEQESPDVEFEKPCLKAGPTWNPIPNMTEMEIREQTKRLATTQINFALFKHKAPEVNLTEYKIFQKARRVIEKVCPDDELPPLFLRGVVRMFRHALNESLGSYPYRMSGDVVENTRILEALTKCYEDPQATKMTFNYNTTACPRQLSSVSVVGGDLKPKTVASAMSCVDRYNTSEHDLIIEAAWKVVLFTHYFCARHFNVSSYDHSRFIEKLSLFFNQEIQHRWFHPGKSYEVLQYVFRTYDLERIAEGIDRCVGAARAASPYRNWVLRPKFYQYCWEDGSLNVQPSDTTLAPTSLSTQGRLAWNGNAYCLRSWTDPLKIIAGYTTDAQQACDKDGSANIFV